MGEAGDNLLIRDRGDDVPGGGLGYDALITDRGKDREQFVSNGSMAYRQVGATKIEANDTD